MAALTPREDLIQALQVAGAARRGVPTELQPIARAFAKAERLRGESVARVLITVKELIDTHVGPDALVFRPKVVGWTIAGYYDGFHRED